MSRKFNNMKMTPKLMTSFVLVLLVASISGITGIFMLVRVGSSYSNALQYNGFAQGRIGEFNTCINRAATLVRNVIILTDPNEIADAKNELTQLVSKTDQALVEVKELCNTAEEQKQIEIIEENLQLYRASRDEVVELAAENRNEEAVELLMSEAVPVFQKMIDT
ncbi:MAG: methyl-accepting chemotaxis protein, partial [Oscillospiraceae bacterium]|nr:methyl-accepting chemotaxis protein [Oscillospiraceae bacterium]